MIYKNKIAYHKLIANEKKYLLYEQVNEIIKIAKKSLKKTKEEDKLYSFNFLLDKSTNF
tara:strand:+ start:125 stop:301 length:177 start_codon:yes stop_codon:yes gene_type:complete